ncbi:MAG TPA: alpha/beta fold hydrolase [Candidatus Baltobacteraceae bacterium]|jgi:alpha-beta hydrolase superfamily lysophospholipase|nr:alpha/beta fold hydrolase [Candidatus Baltobacteraceae bacterium]
MGRPPLKPDTYTALERLLERDHDRIADEGRTKMLHHDEVRPKAIVLFHGLSSSPTQFTRFAHDLYARGHNVLVPRLPRHGHQDRLSDALAYLTSDDLRRTATESVDLARGMGDEVIVAGFSLGGLLATWLAQREPIHRAIAIAPFFGISWVPNRFMNPLASAMLRLPNMFHWWNPITRERQMPEHGYPRYATHAVAHAYRLAQEVFAATALPIEAERLIFVTNAREAAINNRAVTRLARSLRTASPERVEQILLRNVPFVHDIIEPLRHPEIAERVYPQLLEIIEG